MGLLLGLPFGVCLRRRDGSCSGLDARKALDPTLIALYTVPKLALIGVFLLAFGFDEKPIIVVIAVTVFFFVCLQTNSRRCSASGRATARPASRSAADRWQMFRHVILPASLPQIFVGLRIAGGVAVLTMIGAEFVLHAGQKGIGYRITLAPDGSTRRRYVAGRRRA